MLMYFTGTGNSAYIAKKLANACSEQLLFINDKIKAEDTRSLAVNGKLIFVLPTYSWRIPRIVETWIRAVDFIGVKEVYFIMHCGSGIGNAACYNKKLAADKGFKYMGTAQIIMPENYIAMFKTPCKKEALSILSRAESVIEDLIDSIVNGKKLPDPPKNFYDPILSSLVNKVFYAFFVKAKAFYANDFCISCGICEKLCPLNNIKLIDGKPHWASNCTHCMACISYCPSEAIEYGNKSKGKFRYTLEKLMEES